MTVIETLAKRFPQLYIKPENGASQSELYRSVVRRGKPYTGELSHFIGSEKDSLTEEHTPVGKVTVVYLAERSDFECLYRIMACRCEPVKVPETMGACYISGFNDWSKIHAHMQQYKESGGTDTNGEFARFTATPSNYKGTMLILSQGPYSALTADKTNYSEQQWLDISLEIRKYHEITHFICRKLFPDKKYPLWDELLADCIGLIFAVGEYDLDLAKKFLGITDRKYTGGRLENYLKDQPTDDVVEWVLAVMDELERRCEQHKSVDRYELIKLLEAEAENICGGMPR